MGADDAGGWGRAGVMAAWIVGGVLLVLAVAAASFFVVLKLESRSTQVTVPDVTGRDRHEADRIATGSGLLIEIAQERHDPQLPSGRILEQEPPAGASVRKGRKIKVVMSLGGEVLKVPDLVGRTDRQTMIELQREGFVPGDEAVIPFAEASPGTVVAQAPPPGSLAVPGMRLHRLVSGGPPQARWVMPDLVGRPFARVEAWLATCGFRKGVVRRVDATDRPAGTVVGQFPPEGYPVSARDAVDLTVAR